MKPIVVEQKVQENPNPQYDSADDRALPSIGSQGDYVNGGGTQSSDSHAQANAEHAATLQRLGLK